MRRSRFAREWWRPRRPLGWADTLAALWPVHGVVAENGGAAVVRQARGGKAWGRTIYWRSDEERLADQPRLAALRAQILTELPYARLAADQWLRRSDVAFDIGEQLALDAAQIDAITARIRAAGADCLVSSVHAHASFGGANKALMLARVAGELWTDTPLAVDHYLYVGDSPNDQAGFAAFPFSVGVANVTRYAARLAPPPRYVTQAPGGHGFAELTRFVLKNR